MTCRLAFAASIMFPLLAVATSAALAAEPEQMTSTRFDLGVVDRAFDVAVTKTSRGTLASPAGYLGDKAKTGIEVHHKLGRNWEEAWVEFISGGDGFVQINLQGEWYSANRPNDIRYVWVDDVRVVAPRSSTATWRNSRPTASWPAGRAETPIPSTTAATAASPRAASAASRSGWATSFSRGSRSRRAGPIAWGLSSAWPTRPNCRNRRW